MNGAFWFLVYLLEPVSRVLPGKRVCVYRTSLDTACKKMWCLVSQANSFILEVQVDPKAIGQECLEKVSHSIVLVPLSL